MKRILLVVALMACLASSAMAQSMVIKVEDMDRIGRDVQSMMSMASSHRNTDPHGCVFYAYGKAVDGAGFYRSFAYTNMMNDKHRKMTAAALRNKLLNWGSMDVRVYEVTPTGYRETRE